MARPILTRPPRAVTATGIPRDCLYRLPEGMLRMMRSWALDRDALRLLHVLLFRTCRTCPDYWGAPGPQPGNGFREAARDVLGWQGSCPDRGNGAIIEAATRLRTTGAFEWIGPCCGNGALRWRFVDESFAALFADDRYGYLDSRILPHLHGVTALWLLGEIALVRGMTRPQLQLDVEGLHRASGLAGPVSWTSVGRPFIRALAGLAIVHGMRVVLGLMCHHRFTGIDTLDLRLEHAGSSWSTTALGRFDPRVREVIVIVPGGVHRMRPEALPGHLRGRMRMPI